MEAWQYGRAYDDMALSEDVLEMRVLQWDKHHREMALSGWKFQSSMRHAGEALQRIRKAWTEAFATAVWKGDAP